MSWGTGIVILIGGFLLLTIVLVGFAFTQRVDLVDKNYYEKELGFQDHINRQKNSLGLHTPVAYTAKGAELRIQFPIAETGKISEGQVTFYKPSDSRSDMIVPLSTDSTGLFTYSLLGKPLGIWKVSAEWKAKDSLQKGFYSEKEFRLTAQGIEAY